MCRDLLVGFLVWLVIVLFCWINCFGDEGVDGDGNDEK